MEENQFDDIAKVVGTTRTRRSTLKALGLGLLGAAGLAGGFEAEAKTKKSKRNHHKKKGGRTQAQDATAFGCGAGKVALCHNSTSSNGGSIICPDASSTDLNGHCNHQGGGSGPQDCYCPGGGYDNNCDPNLPQCGLCVDAHTACYLNPPTCDVANCPPPTNECEEAYCNSDNQCAVRQKDDGAVCSTGVCCSGTCQECCGSDTSTCPTPPECQEAVCNSGTCGTQNKADNTTCSTGVCCSGTCQECCGSDTSTCPTPTECQEAVCSSGTCGTQNKDDNTPCSTGVCCSGACTDNTTDANCGTCGTACDASQCQTCQNLTCSGTCPEQCNSCTIGFYRQNGCRPGGGATSCPAGSSLCQKCQKYLASGDKDGPCTLDINKALKATGKDVICAQAAAAYLNTGLPCGNNCIGNLDICNASNADLSFANEGNGGIESCPLNAKCKNTLCPAA